MFVWGPQIECFDLSVEGSDRDNVADICGTEAGSLAVDADVLDHFRLTERPLKDHVVPATRDHLVF